MKTYFLKIFFTISIMAMFCPFKANAASCVDQVRVAILGSDLPVEQRAQHFVNRIVGGENPSTIRYSYFWSPGMAEEESANRMANHLCNTLALFGSVNNDIEVKVKEEFPILTFDSEALMQAYGPVPELEKPRFRTNYRNALKAHQLAQSTLDSRGLKWEMLDFWFNHFNVDSNKTFLDVGDYRMMLYKNMKGSFHAMLNKVAKHPAMLVYLDNFRSTKVIGNRGPNENYARELMELHTFGIGPTAGIYTQDTIVKVALILTGWGVTSIGAFEHAHQFAFRDSLHDQSVKVALGHTFQPNGIHEGEKLLEILSSHPRTALNITRKLIRRFVSEDDAATILLRDRMREIFLNSDGNLMALYTEMFSSPEFWSRTAFNNKAKKPHNFIASAMRISGIQIATLDREILIKSFQAADRMGERLAECAPPTGFPERSTHWIQTNNVIESIKYGHYIGDFRTSREAYRAYFERIEEWLLTVVPGARALASAQYLKYFFDLDTFNERFHSSPNLNIDSEDSVIAQAALSPDRISGKRQPMASQLKVIIGSKDFAKY